MLPLLCANFPPRREGGSRQGHGHGQQDSVILDLYVFGRLMLNRFRDLPNVTMILTAQQ